MARAEVAPVLAKEFVLLKIDQDRMVGGKEMLAAARKAVGLKEGGGIPWIIFYDADGRALANGDAADGNIGCPYKDEEIAHFVTMLDKARHKLTPDDIEGLRKSIVTMRTEDEAAQAKAKAAASGKVD
jgi:hypothetical protein